MFMFRSLPIVFQLWEVSTLARPLVSLKEHTANNAVTVTKAKLWRPK